MTARTPRLRSIPRASRHLTGAGSLTLLLLAAVAAGTLPALASPLATLVVCGLGLFVVIIVGFRHTVSDRTSSAAASDGTVDEQAIPQTFEWPEIKLARLCFYLGTLTLGQSVFRFGLTPSEALFFAALALCALGALRGAALRSVSPQVLVSVGVFAFGAALSSIDAQSPWSSAVQVIHAAYVLVLWPWVATMVLRNRPQLLTALALWAVSAAIDGTGAIAQLFGFHGLGMPQASERLTGFTEHANDLGGVTSIALVPALLIASRTNHGHPVLRVIRWLPVGLASVGLVTSGSVTALAAAAVGLVVWLSAPCVRAPARVAVVAAIVCAFAGVAIAGGKVISPTERLTQVINSAASGNTGSAQDRVSVARQAWPRIKRDPFIGTGLDTPDTGVTIISSGYSTTYQTHGLPLAAWYEAGIFGLLGLLSLLVVLVGISWSSMRVAATEDDMLIAWALLAALVAFVINSMTQPMVFQQYAWITAVMIGAWSRRQDIPLARRTREAAVAAGTQFVLPIQSVRTTH